MSTALLPDAGPKLPDGTLLEGIVTTLNEDGSPHIAPMGPIVDADFDRLLLRPFRTSTTYANLKRPARACCTLPTTSNCSPGPRSDGWSHCRHFVPADAVDGVILADACRWYAFRVESLDDRDERTKIVARVVDRGRLRDFFGFNRAKHAVVEAAILATRIGTSGCQPYSQRDGPLACSSRKPAATKSGERSRSCEQLLIATSLRNPKPPARRRAFDESQRSRPRAVPAALRHVQLRARGPAAIRRGGRDGRSACGGSHDHAR